MCRHDDPAQQHVVQLIGSTHQGLRFFSHTVDRRRVEPAQVAHTFDRQRAARGDGPSPPFGDFATVEKGIRVGIQQFITERRGFARIAREQFDLSAFDLFEHAEQSVQVMRFVQTVVHRLLGQGMVWQLEVAGDVLLAAGKLRKNRRQKIVGPKPLQRRRNLLPILESLHQQGPCHIPAPAGLKSRNGQQRLFEQWPDIAGSQHSEHAFQRKAVLRPQREHEPVVIRRRLELEIERPAEALAHRQPPGLGNPRAEWCVDDHLHPARFIEKSLEDDAPLAGNHSQRGLFSPYVFDGLMRGMGSNAALGEQPGFGPGRVFEQGFELFTQARHFLRQLDSSSRSLATPKGNRRRRAFGVGDRHVVAADVQNPPRRISQKKYLSRLALAGEVFVEGADDGLFGFSHDPVRGDFGNGSSIRKGDDACAGTRPHAPSDLVVMQIDSSPPRRARNPFTQKLDDTVEISARQVSVGPGPRTQRKQFVGPPFTASHFGDDLLGENIDRGRGNDDRVEPPRSNRPDQRHGLEQFVAREGEQASFRNQPQGMPRAADPL